MSEVSYSNVPPMMAAIKSGDIEAIRSLLHAGHSPNEPQCYQVMIGDWPRDDEASPLELGTGKSDGHGTAPDRMRSRFDP